MFRALTYLTLKNVMLRMMGVGWLFVISLSLPLPYISLSVSHTHTLFPTHIDYLSFSRTMTHTLSLFLSLYATHMNTHYLFVLHAHTQIHSLFHPVTLSRFLTLVCDLPCFFWSRDIWLIEFHARRSRDEEFFLSALSHKHTHTHSLSRTHTHTFSLTRSLTHSPAK